METNPIPNKGANVNMIETYEYTKYLAGVTKKLKKISKQPNSTKKIPQVTTMNNKIEVYPVKKYKITDTKNLKLSQAKYGVLKDDGFLTGIEQTCNFTNNAQRGTNLYPVHSDFSDFSCSANSFLANVNNTSLTNNYLSIDSNTSSIDDSNPIDASGYINAANLYSNNEEVLDEIKANSLTIGQQSASQILSDTSSSSHEDNSYISGSSNEKTSNNSSLKSKKSDQISISTYSTVSNISLHNSYNGNLKYRGPGKNEKPHAEKCIIYNPLADVEYIGKIVKGSRCGEGKIFNIDGT